MRKFTPRSDTTNWSAANIARIRRLLAAGRVQECGLAAIDPQVMAHIRTSGTVPPLGPGPEPEIPSELTSALGNDPEAHALFDSLAPSYRRTYVRWVASAKRPQTRARRAREAARLLAAGVKNPLK